MSKERATALRGTISLLGCVLAVSLLPAIVAGANSLPPPSVVWFRFDYPTAPATRLLGVQLIACVTAGCDEAVLLQQYGTCNQAGCATSPATLAEWGSEFGCAGNLCRSTAYPSHGGTDLRLVAQFSDRVRTSNVVSRLPSQYGEAAAWHVLVRAMDLALEPDATLPALQEPFELFRRNLWRIGLSIVVELLVAGLCFRMMARTDGASLMERLLTVLLVNLLSIPVVWLFFPSLGQFQTEASQGMGLFALLVSLFYAVLLVGIDRTQERTRGCLVTLLLVSLPVMALVWPIVRAMTSYTGSDLRGVIVQGVPGTAVILVSELFAVVFEAILMALLGKRPWHTRWIWITSLVMNAASVVAGLLLNRIGG